MPARKKASWELAPRSRRAAQAAPVVRCEYVDVLFVNGCPAAASHDIGAPDGGVFADGRARILLCDYHFAMAKITGPTRRQLLGDGFDPPETWTAPDGTVWESA